MESLKSFCQKLEDANCNYKEIEEAFASIGVNLKNEDGTFKNLIDIFEEASTKFDKNEKI